MTSLSDLRKDLSARMYERVSSPLYSTFIISWIITNWRLIYITIFESSESLGRGKFYYIVNVLYPGGNCWNYFCSISMLYLMPALWTFIIIWWLPELVNKAHRKYESFKSERRKAKHEIQEVTTVPGDIFLDLKMKYDEQIKSYIKSLKNVQKNEVELSELKTQHQEVINSASAIEQDLKSVKASFDSLKTDYEVVQKRLASLSYGLGDLFQGYWMSRYVGPRESGEEVFAIREGYKYMVLSSPGPDVRTLTHIFDIDRLQFDGKTKTLKFRKVDVTERAALPLEVVLTETGPGVWSGTENGITKITWTRVELSDFPKVQIK